jgi:hypothetical protein
MLTNRPNRPDSLKRQGMLCTFTYFLFFQFGKRNKEFVKQRETLIPVLIIEIITDFETMSW